MIAKGLNLQVKLSYWKLNVYFFWFLLCLWMCIICQECNRRNGTHFQLDITPFIEMINLLWFFSVSFKKAKCWYEIIFWLISSGFFSYSKPFLFQQKIHAYKKWRKKNKKKKNSRKVNVSCVPKVMPITLPSISVEKNVAICYMFV